MEPSSAGVRIHFLSSSSVVSTALNLAIELPASGRLNREHAARRRAVGEPRVHSRRRGALQHGLPGALEAQLGARATGKPGGTLGPEFGIANFGGSFKQDNVMLLKSCIGNRALGYDILPPGTARHDYTDASGTAWTYAGYGDSAMKWLKNGAKLRLGLNFPCHLLS